MMPLLQGPIDVARNQYEHFLRHRYGSTTERDPAPWLAKPLGISIAMILLVGVPSWMLVNWGNENREGGAVFSGNFLLVLTAGVVVGMCGNILYHLLRDNSLPAWDEPEAGR